MLIWLPPSEGKYAPSRGARLDLDTLSFPTLTPAREQVLTALEDLCRNHAEAGEVLGLGSTQRDQIARNEALRDAPTARADRVYTGVLYDALDAASLSPAAKRRAARRLVIASALFGMLRPADRIPAYRLSGDVRLPHLGGVGAHWRRHLGEEAEAAVGGGLLVDLRSGVYAAHWRPPSRLAGQTATVRVLHDSGGRRSVVSHFNKATKGRLVRSLLEEGAAPATPGELAACLRDLGWEVEEDRPGPQGTRLDVVVTEV